MICRVWGLFPERFRAFQTSVLAKSAKGHHGARIPSHDLRQRLRPVHLQSCDVGTGMGGHQTVTVLLALSRPSRCGLTCCAGFQHRFRLIRAKAHWRANRVGVRRRQMRQRRGRRRNRLPDRLDAGVRLRAGRCPTRPTALCASWKFGGPDLRSQTPRRFRI